MHILHQFLAVALAISAALVALDTANAQQPANQQACIADWSEAGPIVRREGLATIERVGRLVRDRAAVEILTSSLCQDDGRYVYRLLVRGGQGSVKILVVDARTPFGP